MESRLSSGTSHFGTSSGGTPRRSRRRSASRDQSRSWAGSTPRSRRWSGASTTRSACEFGASSGPFTSSSSSSWAPASAGDSTNTRCSAAVAGGTDNTPPPIESLVVVLTGRKPWPTQGKHRTGWPEQKWSGIHYRIDAVYQRTVAELRARGSVLWLVFVPLARDATLEAVGGVLEELRRRVTDPEELGDLFAALLVMADVDPWGHNLREEIAAMVETSTDLLQVSKTLRETFEKGRREAVLDMLRRLFVRRMGRPLTEQEQKALAMRATREASDPADMQEHALSLEGEALAAWLLDPNAK